jgi:hypothetical protein
MSKKLNGLPNNLAESFFSSLKYDNGGYMADWLVAIAQKHTVNEVRLDVIHQSATPSVFNVKPVTLGLGSLKYVISSELEANHLPLDFIAEAALDVKFNIPYYSKKVIHVFPWVIDKDGKKYEHGRLIFSSTETDFKIDKPPLVLHKSKLNKKAVWLVSVLVILIMGSIGYFVSH